MEKNKVPSIITIAILTLITTIFWVFFSIYRTFTIKPPPSVPEEILAPIDPSLDTNALTKLSERRYFEESLIPDIKIEGKVTTPTLIFSQAPNPSPTTSLESPTPIASPSGGTQSP